MRQIKRWLSVKGVADYCLVSRVTVRRWVKDGKLPATRLPSGHYRVSIADFRGFLERYEIPLRGELFVSDCFENGRRRAGAGKDTRRVR